MFSELMKYLQKITTHDKIIRQIITFFKIYYIIVTIHYSYSTITLTKSNKIYYKLRMISGNLILRYFNIRIE